MSRISSTAKIPLKQFMGKGSYDKRLNYAKSLNSKFFQQMLPEIKTGEISPINYRKVLKNLLPDNINVHLKALSKYFSAKGFKGAVTFLGEDEFNGFEISLPYIKKYGKSNKNAKISAKMITTIMHENFHVFSELCNPKHLARCKFKDDSEYKIYAKNLYGETKGVFGFRNIKNILKYLKRIPLKERIDFLQNCRYRLTEEHHAFAEGAKYCMGKYNYVPFEFYTQISFIETLLYLTLQKARKENKLKYANK